MQEILSDNQIAYSEEIHEKVKSRFVALVKTHIDLNGSFLAVLGAQDFVNRIKNSPRHVCAYATGGWAAAAEAKLRSAGFDTENVPLFSADIAIKRTDIMLAALNALGGNFKRVTYYGDGHWDQEACRILGWEFRPVGAKLSGLLHFENEFI